MRLIVTVDSGDSDEITKIIAEVNGCADLLDPKLHLAINNVLKNGVHDAVNKTWYPPHKVCKIEYESF